MNRKRATYQPELIGIPPVRPTVKASPRHDLSKIDAWGLVALFVISMAALCVAVFIPGQVKEKAASPRWRLPGIERPADLDEVEGLYPTITKDGARIERIHVFYMRRIEIIAGKEALVEGWHRDDGDGTAGLDLGRPMWWAPRDEAKALALPEIPDNLLWARAKDRMTR